MKYLYIVTGNIKKRLFTLAYTYFAGLLFREFLEFGIVREIYSAKISGAWATHIHEIFLINSFKTAIHENLDP